MKKISLFIIPISFFLFFGLASNSQAACIGASPTWTSSPDQSSVRECVAQASMGDTINVTAGVETWSTEYYAVEDDHNHLLFIKKGIILNGGVGGPTVITLAGASDLGQIEYRPDAASVAANATFEIKNFTFDGGSVYKNSGLFVIVNTSTTTPISNLKIHNNIFKNAYHTGIYNYGLSYGVIYSNTFTNVGYPFRTAGAGGDQGSWGRVPLIFGNDTNIFFEDNIINATSPKEIGITDPGGGAAGMVYRYNSIDLNNASGISGLWDVHGLQSGHVTPYITGTAQAGSSTVKLVDSTKDFGALGVQVGSSGDTIMCEVRIGTDQATRVRITSISTTNSPNDTLNFSSYGSDPIRAGDVYHVSQYYCPSGAGYSCTKRGVATDIGSFDETIDQCQQWSTLKTELYGNKIISPVPYSNWSDIRGGQQLLFNNYNNVTYGDPPDYYFTIKYSQFSCDSCQSPGFLNAGGDFVQHVQNTYVWSNYVNEHLRNMTKNLDHCADYSVGKPYTIEPNKDYWNNNISFDGTSGMGCGTLANRPKNCTIGVGYWVPNPAIDASASSCTNLADYVGANNAKAKSVNGNIGTLYRCTSANHWEVYYTPYTYPHPLRNESTCLTPGDFTCNGYSISDLQTMISIILGTDTTTSYTQADMSTPPDGLVNISDLQLLIKKVLGIN